MDDVVDDFFRSSKSCPYWKKSNVRPPSKHNNKLTAYGTLMNLIRWVLFLAEFPASEDCG
jgi:hypothetical protein